MNWQQWRTLCLRDIRLAMRRPGETLHVLFFFIMTVTLFPLASSPSATTLQAIGPGVLWVCAVLACLLLLGELLESDWRDGALEALLFMPLNLPLALSAKIVARWLCGALPLVMVSPLLGLQLELPTSVLPMLAGTLALGTLALLFIGAPGAALILGTRNGGMLLGLLILPLFLPVLIFGALAVAGAQAGRSVEAELSILLALTLLAVFFSPLATAACLRLACE